ncbi:MAG: CoA transferase [Pseudomonadota bacterium]
MTRPLEGLRIVDFTHVLAGPFATRVLGDMGADVVKVNSESRALTSNVPSHPYYVMWNRNKRALSLNMSEPDAQTLCRSLCEKADIVIDNFSVGVLDRWGVGYEVVSQTNPGVIYIQMSGMGEGGPWSRFVTYAPTIHALSGLTAMTGVPGREDIGLGFSYNDHQAGLHGAFAVLAALESRHHTGLGQRIEVSQFEVGVNFAGPAILDLFANGVGAQACGNLAPYDNWAPHNVYQCAPLDVADVVDQRWIAIVVENDQQWQALKDVMGQPDWAQDSRFDEAAGRYALRDDLDQHLAAWVGEFEDYDLMALCQSAGVPAGVVQNGRDLLESDPQIEASGFARRIEDLHPEIGQTWADSLPITFSERPCEEYNRVRMLGEDNADILHDWLNLDGQETQTLADRGILK